MRVGTAIRTVNWPGPQSCRRTQSAPRAVRTRGRPAIVNATSSGVSGGGVILFHDLLPLSRTWMVKRWLSVNNTPYMLRTICIVPGRRKSEPENRGNRAFSGRHRWRGRWRRCRQSGEKSFEFFKYGRRRRKGAAWTATTPWDVNGEFIDTSVSFGTAGRGGKNENYFCPSKYRRRPPPRVRKLLERRLCCPAPAWTMCELINRPWMYFKRKFVYNSLKWLRRVYFWRVHDPPAALLFHSSGAHHIGGSSRWSSSRGVPFGACVHARRVDAHNNTLVIGIPCSSRPFLSLLFLQFWFLTWHRAGK